MPLSAAPDEDPPGHAAHDLPPRDVATSVGAGEAGSHSASAAAAGTSGDGSGGASSARATTASETFAQVEVFYATNRRAEANPEYAGTFHVPSLYLAAAAGCLAIVCGTGALVRRRSRWLLIPGGVCGMGAGALLVWGAMASVHFQERADRELRLYGGERGELEMGTCLVSIPHIHRLGELEAPSIWRLELHEDPARHVVLLETQVQPADQFFTRLRERVANSPRKDCFVFIHGYANTFEDAARRTAQMAHDLEFAGAAVFFSWPAQGGVLDYVTDRENMDWAVGDLEQFLLDVARQSQARSIHLIAHSMGNRGLTAALRSVARELEDGPLFHQVVLTAPDIDAAVFRRSIMPEIRGTAERFTLYASANDAALKLSRQFNGFPRVGDTNDGLVVLPGLDTIDVSEVDTSLLGHAYYGGNQSVLLDLRELLERGASPAERQFLRPMAAGQLTYWVFRRLPLAEQPAVGPTR